MSDTHGAWNRGYWDGLSLKDKNNPYNGGTEEWKAYERGWEEGWLDS